MDAKNYRVRSNSFPTKPHPVLAQAEAHLGRLRASETAVSSFSSSIASQRLSGLLHLHDSIDELLELTLARQALLGECGEEKRIATELLEGSVRVADLCGTARNLLAETKEFVQELQSILRRKGDKMGNIVSIHDLKNCLAARKMTKKAIRKPLKAIESKKKRQTKQENSAVIGLLREAEAVTLNGMEHLLRSLAGCNPPSKTRSFSFVSKLVNPRREDEEERQELQTVDLALSWIMGNKRIKEQDLQNILDKLESSFGAVEEDVESLYRKLIRHRVSLLNVFNH